MLENVKKGIITGGDAWEFANDKKLFLQWAPKEGIMTQVGGPPSADDKKAS